MRRCPKCGNSEPESTKFCTVCGGSMEGATRHNPFREGEEAAAVVDAAAIRQAIDLAEEEDAKLIDALNNDDQPQKEKSDRHDLKMAIIVVILLMIAVAIALVAVMWGGSAGDTKQNTTTVTESDTAADQDAEEEQDEDEIALEVTHSDGESDEEEDTDAEQAEDADTQEDADESETTEEDTRVYTYTEMNTTLYVVSGVNVRSQPNTDGEILGSLKQGTAVTVTGKCNESDWYRVVYNDDVGYVYAPYLEESDESESTEAETRVYTFTDMNTTLYVVSGVNVRDLPSSEGEILGSLKQGTAVTVTGKCNESDWYRVVYNDDVGYVYAPYLEEADSSTSDSTTTTTTSKTYNGTTITTDYILSGSSTGYISTSDLTGLSANELKLARNEIYARHGYIFKDSTLQAYFESCSWYSGTVSYSDFDEDELNEYEKANAKTIREYEASIS